MKKQLILLATGFLTAVMLTACGQDPEITEFKQEIDDFCTKISVIDTSINNIDARTEGATTELLGYLDELDTEFRDFAKLDFPEEFDYLESLADESSSYMTEAVQNYKKAYSDGYDGTTAEYAKENYSKAYKRIQIIITFLHGEKPEDVNLITQSEES